jgi:cytosine/adenosine deaminase-related metal-dependent hydrolase
MADEFTLTARWIFPVTAAPLERGTVTVRGDRILAVEPRGHRKADIDLGNVAITPGFVNAHTHLDLTGARGKTPPTPDFVGWLRDIIAFRRERTADETTVDVDFGIADALRFGTTFLADISADGGTWDQLAAAPMRAVVFRELIGLSDDRTATALEALNWWKRSAKATPTCRPGISPHAPYSVAEVLYEHAAAAWMPLTIHLAESRDELKLLAERAGELVAFLQQLGAWCPKNLMGDLTRPIQLVNPRRPFLFVHCNYLSTAVPFPPNASIVYCPRTHAAFGHPPHPFRQFLARGVRVALGTDSLASNPDLSVLAEARLVSLGHPDLPGGQLLRMATLSGAEALGWADVTGSLDAGKSADFAIVALPDHAAADPHEMLFESELPVVATWFRGREVFKTSKPPRTQRSADKSGFLGAALRPPR